MKKLLLLLFAITILVGCELIPEDTIHTIRYEVVGNATGVEIDWNVDDGDTLSQHTIITNLPWSYEYNYIEQEYSFIYTRCVAINNSGTYTVNIYNDNEKIATGSTTDGYVYSSYFIY